jgi:hypothetical protein
VVESHPVINPTERLSIEEEVEIGSLTDVAGFFVFWTFLKDNHKIQNVPSGAQPAGLDSAQRLACKAEDWTDKPEYKKLAILWKIFFPKFPSLDHITNFIFNNLKPNYARGHAK